MICIKKVVRIFCLVALVSMVYGLGYADEFKLTPTIGVREAYDDNLFFSTSNEVDDYITRIFGGLDLLNRTDQLDLNLSAKADGLLYADNTDLNDVEQFYKGDVGYRLTERVKLAASGGYSQDSRPDRDIETTGFVFTGVKRKRWNAGASADFTLSEISALSVSYAFERDTFDKPEYVDYDFHAAGLGYTRDLSKILPRLIGRVNAGYAYFSTDDTDVKIWSATLGFSRDITEIFNLLVDAGARYAASEFQVAALVPYPPYLTTVTETQYDWGPTGRIVLSYKGETTRSDITAAKEVQPASGNNGTADRTSFLFNIRHRFAEKFSAHLSAQYFLNKANAGELSTQAIDEETVSIQPGLSCEIIEHLVLTASYTYTQVKYKISDTEAKRNRVFVQMSYGIPLFE
jgi:hypothetical protein